MERVGWIDFLRGIAIILILVFHTEVYYKEYSITHYYIYTTNAILLFYFISGYLFFRQGKLYFIKKIKSIVRSLLIPYFIFTSVISILKPLVRHQALDWQNIMITILSGRASWFIAALILGELLFTAILKISRGKHQWLSTLAVVCFIIYYLIPFNQHNYWQWQDALLTYFFLYIGYVFHQYQSLFHNINKPIYSSLFLLILIFIKIYEYHVDIPMRNIAVNHGLLFLADAVVWLLLVVTVIHFIPRNKMIEWTGQHSIVYYFLAGGCPLLVSILMNKAGWHYENFLWRFILAFILTYVFATILTWGIYHFFPFVLGKKSMNKK